MGRKCNVQDCLSDSRLKEDQGVTFHKVPLHNDIRPKWISLCRISEKQQLNKVIYVCSRHFLKADFCKFKGSKYFLKQGALPSVFPWAPKVTQTDSNDSSFEENTDMETEIKTEIKSEPEDSDTEKKSEDTEQTVQIKTEVKTEIDKSMSNIDDIKIKQDMFTKTDSAPRAVAVKSENMSAINFTPGVKIQASDFGDKWFTAHITEVDYDENEVLVRYEACLNRGDEWISMDSSRLRPFQQNQSVPKPPIVVNKSDPLTVGEKCMAVWIDARRFPATVVKIINDDTYEILFDDGVRKILKRSKLIKRGEIQPPPDCRVHISPLFDPVVGSKEDRRERKRKINVAELFSTKRRYKHEEHTQISHEEERFPIEETSYQNEGEEWTCRWMNGEPVGQESILQTVDGPRRSIIVPDHRLPTGWEKHLSQRLHGTSAGKWETIIRSPEGKRFRTRTDIKNYIIERNLNFALEQFDFGLHLNRARKLGLYEVTDPAALSPSTPRPVIKPYRQSTPKTSTPKSTGSGHLSEAQDFDDDDYVEDSNCLKIICENDSYKCPIDGCDKNFRRENLAQMHIKHYHPEYTKLLGSTPNVADLAYARTVGEPIDDIVPKTRLSLPPLEKPVKSEQSPKPKSTIKVLTPKTPKIEETDLKKIERTLNAPSPTNIPKPATKDAEIIRLLNSDPKSKGIDPIFDPNPPDSVDPFKFDPEIPKYPEIKLKDLLYKAEPIPIKKDEVRTGIKTLLPVIRNTDDSKKDSHDLEGIKSIPTTSKHVEKGRPGRKRLSDIERRRRAKIELEDFPDYFEADSQSQDEFKMMDEVEQPQVIIEGGEVIRLVHMRREEIINCTCGITEEDGLMIQCELCLCWQHGHCNNILRENQVPEKYVCYICTHPQRMRPSKKYVHEQDWMKQGALTSASYHAKDDEQLSKKTELLRRSHELSGGLIELNEYLHNLRVKLGVAENKDHPKLYLWAKPWDKVKPEHTINFVKEEDIKLDIKNESFNDDHSYLKSSAFGDLSLKTVLEPPVEIKEEIKTEDKITSQSELLSILEGNTEMSDKKQSIGDKLSEFPKIDLNNLIVSSLTKTRPKSEQKESDLNSLELPLTQLDLEKLSTLAQLEVESSMSATEVSAPCIPQPEVAIDSSDCQLNLLEHIEFFQNMVEKRLDAIETQIVELERQEPDPYSNESHDCYPRTKQTLQMLIRDLNTMRQISAISH